MKTKARKPRSIYLSCNLACSTCASNDFADVVPRLALRHIALQFPVAGKNRFLQLDRFSVKAPRFSNRLVYARHYRLGPTSRVRSCCCPRVL